MRWGIALVLCQLPVGMLIYELNNYEPHTDGALGTVIVSGLILILLLLLTALNVWEKMKS